MIFSIDLNLGEISKVVKKNTEQIKKTNSPIHTYARNKPLSIFTTFRNIIWSFGKWDNKNLSAWIEEFSPEVIFFVRGGATFSYNISNRISNKSIEFYNKIEKICIKKELQVRNLLWEIKIIFSKPKRLYN